MIAEAAGRLSLKTATWPAGVIRHTTPRVNVESMPATRRFPNPSTTMLAAVPGTQNAVTIPAGLTRYTTWYAFPLAT